MALAVADWLYSEIFACLPFLHALCQLQMILKEMWTRKASGRLPIDQIQQVFLGLA